MGLPPDRSYTCCKVGNLLCWLDGMKNQPATDLLRKNIVWLQVTAEYGDWWDGLSDDPLDSSLHAGQSGKARRTSHKFREAVAREAAQGEHGRSGKKVLKLIKRFRHYKKDVPFADAVANRWVEPSVRRYWGQLQVVMQSATQPVYSLAWDATRLSGDDLLFSSMYAPSVQKACWCAPKAPSPTGIHHVHFCYPNTMNFQR